MDPGGAKYPAWVRPSMSTRCTASWPASVTSNKGWPPLLPLVVVVAAAVMVVEVVGGVKAR
jgi:hypothetical protein